MDILSWIINIGAIIGWVVNIKARKYAMIIFAATTILSIVYFGVTAQVPFFARSIFYLVIDIATLIHIKNHEVKQ
jgi:hypothetical protein